MTGKRGPKLTHEQRERVVKAYLDGDRVAEIATRFEVSPHSVRTIVRRAGFIGSRPAKPYSRQRKVEQVIEPVRMAPPPAPVASFYDQGLADILRLKAKGLTITKIAALLRLPYRVVDGAMASA